MAAAPLCSDTCERQTKGEREAKQKALKMQKKRSRNPVKYLKCSGHRTEGRGQGQRVCPHGALPIKLRAKSKRRLWKGLEKLQGNDCILFFFTLLSFLFYCFRVVANERGGAAHTHTHAQPANFIRLRIQHLNGISCKFTEKECQSSSLIF